MVHQIKAQLTASLEKIDNTAKIENLCSKLSATLAMSLALDKAVGVTNFEESFFENLYVQVLSKVDTMIVNIQNYEKKEEPTE